MSLLPRGLRPGACVGMFTPSWPAPAHWNDDRAAQFLREQGFRVKYGALYGKRDGYRSGDICERAAEFNALLHDDEVDCLMTASGGYVSNSMLPHLDYAYLQANPKVIMGLSDVTALLLGIFAKTGLVTFYGPCLDQSQRTAQIPLADRAPGRACAGQAH